MATSTKQVVATVPVYDYLTPALAGKQVKVTLAYDKARSISPVTWLENLVYPTLIDANGFWQVYVVATDNMTPSGITYIVEVEGYMTYRINPTQAGVPAIGWQSSAILIDVPGPLTTAGGTIGGPITITGGLNLTPGETGLDTNSPGALLIGDNVATSVEIGAVTNVPALQILGLTGAVAASRYVGATAYGSPTTGTFQVGDYVISQASGAVIVCSVAGSPGTWTFLFGTYNVRDFGATGNCQVASDGVMNGTTGVLTSVSGRFVAGDAGKQITVAGAGAAGALLATTIASYQSATQVTLTAASQTAVGAATVTWGSDDRNAIQNAINAASGGGTIFFPIGNYLVTSEVFINNANLTLLGVFGASIITTAGSSYSAAGGDCVFLVGSSGVGVANPGFVNLSFVLNNPNARGIRVLHYTNLLIDRCTFTGAAVDSGGAITGAINLVGDSTDNITARIRNCSFTALPGLNGINVYIPSAAPGKLIVDTQIEANYFNGVKLRCVYINAVQATSGIIRDVKITRNTAIDTIGDPRVAGPNYSCLVNAGAATPYKVEALVVEDNYLSNSRADERRGFALIYHTTGVKVNNNHVVMTATDSGNSDGLFLAVGRVSNPAIGVQVRGNYVDGNFVISVIDNDSCTDLTIADNHFRRCFGGLYLGYGIQTRVDIHDNLYYNCQTSVNAPTLGAIVLANVTNPPSVCKIHDNTIVDDRNPAVITSALYITGGTFDFSDVDIYNNKIYLANSNLANTVVDQATSTRPRMYGKFQIFQLNGSFYEDLAQSVAVAGAGTVTPDPLLGHIVNITYSGSFTIAAPLNAIAGRQLLLKLIHDATTGAYAITWNAAFKTNWQPPAVASAAFSLRFEYDGTGWQLTGVPVDQSGNVDFSGHLISSLTGTPATSNLGANVTSVTFAGNDTRGTIAIVMSAGLAANTRVATCTFATSYGATGPKITLVDQTSTAGLAIVNPYVQAQATGVSFDLAFDQALVAGTYTIDYIVIG